MIDGNLSLARQGDIDAAYALEVAVLRARELCELLDALLDLAAGELAAKEDWKSRVTDAQTQARRLSMRTAAATERARLLIDALAIQSPRMAGAVSTSGERRDLEARAARDAIAARAGLHPRELGALQRRSVVLLAAAFVRDEATL